MAVSVSWLVVSLKRKACSGWLSLLATTCLPLAELVEGFPFSGVVESSTRHYAGDAWREVDEQMPPRPTHLLDASPLVVLETGCGPDLQAGVAQRDRLWRRIAAFRSSRFSVSTAA